MIKMASIDKNHFFVYFSPVVLDVDQQQTFDKQGGIMETRQGSMLIDRLYTKRNLLAKGSSEHKKIRPVLLILGGGMRGASGIGAVYALHLLGLQDVFDVVVGISTGAGISACFLSGAEVSRRGAAIYYEDLAKGFINVWRKPITDIDLVERVLRKGIKSADMEAIHRSRSQFYTCVTDRNDVTPVFLDAKRAKPDVISAVKASMAIPGFYNKTVEVNGRQYVDGSVNPFPTRRWLELFNPTDILVIANCTEESGRDREPKLFEKALNLYFMREVPNTLRTMWTSRYERWTRGLNHFRSLTDVHTGILWAPTKLEMLSRDPEELRHASEAAVVDTFEAFGRTPPAFML